MSDNRGTMTAECEGFRAATDHALVGRCLDGEQQAWEELVRRYQRLVFSIPLQYGLSEDECSDVFQDVFLALLRGLPNLRDRQSLAKWLITTSHRTAWHAIRRARPEAGSQTVDEDRALEPSLPPEDLAVLWERQHLLRQAMDRLDERCRHLLTALYLNPSGSEYRAVGERLGMPVGSIGPSRSRCLGKLVRIARSMGLEDNR